MKSQQTKADKAEICHQCNKQIKEGELCYKTEGGLDYICLESGEMKKGEEGVVFHCEDCEKIIVQIPF